MHKTLTFHADHHEGEPGQHRLGTGVMSVRHQLRIHEDEDRGGDAERESAQAPPDEKRPANRQRAAQHGKVCVYHDV